MDLTNLFLS